MGKVTAKTKARIDDLEQLIARIDKGIIRREQMIELMRASRAHLVNQRAAIIEKANA